MSQEHLTGVLAERVMGWTVAPDRFLTGDRHWISRWRFQPFDDIKDAFLLLKAAGASLVLTVATDGAVTSKVRVGDRAACAVSASTASSIAGAISLTLGLE